MSLRYPLIIDPSGQATEFIMNEYKDRKITRTSFLDDAFRKNLESALRFGNPLLVQVRVDPTDSGSFIDHPSFISHSCVFPRVSQDVESYDPILNPVLNREVRRTGGRVLITLGDQDIDLSPSFVIFLSTRDPTVHDLMSLTLSGFNASDWSFLITELSSPNTSNNVRIVSCLCRWSSLPTSAHV